MTFALVQEMVKGSPQGTIDADLLKVNPQHFSTNADKQLELIPAVVVDNANLPALGSASTTVAPSQRATRQALLDLDAVGRLLPATAGDQGTYLAGDKTFQPLPAQFTRTELAFGERGFNPSHTTQTSDNRQTYVVPGTYDVDDWDLIHMYIGDPSDINNYSQVRTWQTWAPGDIPPETVGPNDATWTPARRRYMRGVGFRLTMFDSNSGERPLEANFSVAKTSAGRLRINALHFTHWNNITHDWFGFNALETVRYGIYGIRY